MISFYKPNSKNTGTACSFSVNTKDNSVWSSLIKQNGWNDAKKIGSFSGNQNNPDKSVRIKFSLVEAAGILDALNRNIEFSAYHSSERQITRIKFAPYIKDGNQVGYSYMVSKENKENSENKQNYLIGFYFSEASLLKEFISYALRTIFEASRLESIKKIKNPSKNTQESFDQNEPDGELW